MKILKFKRLIKEVLTALFPNFLAYTNFTFMILFTITIIIGAAMKDLVIVLISGLGAIYFMNEWHKQTEKGKD